MSRRARNRPDKRELARTVHSVDSHDLDMDLAAACVEHDPPAKDEDEAITTTTGQRIDVRADWRFPTN